MNIIMTKEDWINSRTNNPDRLGKDVWGAAYDYFMKNPGSVPNTEINKLTPLLFEMTKDFFAKIGCEYSQDEIKQVFNSEGRTGILAQLLSRSSENMSKGVVDLAMEVYVKKTSNTGKSPYATLAAAAKKFFGR